REKNPARSSTADAGKGGKWGKGDGFGDGMGGRRAVRGGGPAGRWGPNPAPAPHRLAGTAPAAPPSGPGYGTHPEQWRPAPQSRPGAQRFRGHGDNHGQIPSGGFSWQG